MKKIVSLFICCVCIIFVACNPVERQYTFLNSNTEIVTIEIGHVFDYTPDDPTRGPTFDSVLEIGDHEKFLIDFKAMTCYMRYPHAAEGIPIGQLAIKISYHNGEYEIIGVSGQVKYLIGREHLVNDTAYQHWGAYNFTDEEFSSLMDKYLNLP